MKKIWTCDFQVCSPPLPVINDQSLNIPLFLAGKDEEPLAAAGRLWTVLRLLLNLAVFGGLIAMAAVLLSVRPRLNPFRIESGVGELLRDKAKIH